MSSMLVGHLLRSLTLRALPIPGGRAAPEMMQRQIHTVQSQDLHLYSYPAYVYEVTKENSVETLMR